MVVAFVDRTGNEQSDALLAALLVVFTAAQAHYKNDPEAAQQLLGFGESKRDESLDVAEHAAWTIVASSILNLDETLTRG